MRDFSDLLPGTTEILFSTPYCRFTVNSSAVPKGIITFSVEWLLHDHWWGYLFTDYDKAADYYFRMAQPQLSFW